VPKKETSSESIPTKGREHRGEQGQKGGARIRKRILPIEKLLFSTTWPPAEPSIIVDSAPGVEAQPAVCWKRSYWNIKHGGLKKG